MRVLLLLLYAVGVCVCVCVYDSFVGFWCVRRRFGAFRFIQIERNGSILLYIYYIKWSNVVGCGVTGRRPQSEGMQVLFGCFK